MNDPETFGLFVLSDYFLIELNYSYACAQMFGFFNQIITKLLRKKKRYNE